MKNPRNLPGTGGPNTNETRQTVIKYPLYVNGRQAYEVNMEEIAYSKDFQGFLEWYLSLNPHEAIDMWEATTLYLDQETYIKEIYD